MKLASIEKIEKVYEHPNADKLELVKVLGFQCVVPIGLYQEGDLIIYIQPDTVLPKNQKWAEEYLKYSPKRVRACKIRQEWSEGIVVPLTKFNGDTGIVMEILDEGEEVSEMIGVVKYDPPLPKDIQAKGGLPYQISKTDEERCLSEETLITTDKGNIKIKDICEKEIECSVLSYNEILNIFEYKEITNYSIKRNNNDWFEIELENGTKIQATSNHKFYIPELMCYRELKNLNIGDNLLINKTD